MVELEKLVRPAIRSVKAYLPGKPIGEVRRELGLKRVVKLASNENPLGVSPKALAALRRSAAGNNLYPEGASPLLRQAIARSAGVEPAQVVVGNGSDEIARLLCEAFLDPGDEAVVSQYGFIRFRQQAGLMGARVVEVPAAGLAHDLAAMAAAVTAKTKLVFVASPNNPTGTYSPASELERFLAAVDGRAIVALDEAYYDYALAKDDYPRSLPVLARRFPNLVVMRTFSKAYGLAGLRVGYGVAGAELVSWLDRIRMPFNVCLPAQLAAEAALGDAAFVRRSVALVERQKRKLEPALRELGLAPEPTAANFFCVRSPLPGRTLFERLLREGVIVRPLDEYGLPDHVRVSIGDESQNKLLLSALRKILLPRPALAIR